LTAADGKALTIAVSAGGSVTLEVASAGEQGSLSTTFDALECR